MIRLLRALNHFRKIRTASEADRLSHVFATIADMGHDRYNDTRARYLGEPAFCQLLAARPTLSERIADMDALASMPENSLGRALHQYLADDEIDYAKFLTQYDDAGLSAKAGVHKKYNDRERDLHDLTHVLFSYERTRFGEAATISTQYWQGGPAGFAVIAFAGILRYVFIRPRYALLVLRALFSAYARQAGTDLRMYPFEHNLHKPLSTVRAELGIKPASPALRTVLANTRWED